MEPSGSPYITHEQSIRVALNRVRRWPDELLSDRQLVKLQATMDTPPSPEQVNSETTTVVSTAEATPSREKNGKITRERQLQLRIKIKSA